MFSSLTQPKLPKAALGLEKDLLTAVAVQREGRGQFAISQAACLELPTGLLTPGFLERNISNRHELTAFIEDVTERAGLARQKNWSISLPGSTARSVIITLDSEPASKQEKEEVLDWKAESSFGAPADAMRLSLQSISPDPQGKPRYFATAVKLAVLDEYETLFESLDWHAGLILPRAVSEANWLIARNGRSDSLLISSNNEGFTAMLLRGDEPIVVRSVVCGENETDDEIYRLLMFYNDRLTDKANGGLLERILLIGKRLKPARIRDISLEALGRELRVLRPDDVGLNIPVSNFSFDDVAAPAGIAALGWN